MAVKASDSITLAKVNSITDAQAKAIEDTKAYFFYDDDGAHVTTNEGDATTGNNVLIDADGMKIRDGETELASFGADTIKLGENAYNTMIEFCDKALFITGSIGQPGKEDEGVRDGSIDSMGELSLSSNSTMSLFGMRGAYINAGGGNPVIQLETADGGTISLRADTITINGNPALTYGKTLLASVNHGTTTGSSVKSTTVTLGSSITNYRFLMIVNHSQSQRFSAIFPTDDVLADGEECWHCTNPVNNPGYFAGFQAVNETTLKIQSYREQVWIYGLCPV